MSCHGWILEWLPRLARHGKPNTNQKGRHPFPLPRASKVHKLQPIPQGDTKARASIEMKLVEA